MHHPLGDWLTSSSLSVQWTARAAYIRDWLTAESSQCPPLTSVLCDNNQVVFDADNCWMLPLFSFEICGWLWNLNRAGCGRPLLRLAAQFMPQDTAPQCAAEDSAVPTAESYRSAHATCSSRYDGTMPPEVPHMVFKWRLTAHQYASTWFVVSL